MTATTTAPDPDLAPEPEDERVTLGTIFRDYVTKVRSGDVGSLPAVLGLVALVVLSRRGATAGAISST